MKKKIINKFSTKSGILNTMYLKFKSPLIFIKQLSAKGTAVLNIQHGTKHLIHNFFFIDCHDVERIIGVMMNFNFSISETWKERKNSIVIFVY